MARYSAGRKMLLWVSNFAVSRAKNSTAGRTARSSIALCLLFVCAQEHVLMIFKTDNSAFVHDTVVKYGHGIWPAIHYQISLVFYNVGDSVARKTANAVLVNNSVPSIIVLVVVYCGLEKFEIADEIKRETELFFLEFEGAVLALCHLGNDIPISFATVATSSEGI